MARQASSAPAVFETDADAIILSIQPDLMVSLVRSRRHGYLLLPAGWTGWPQADRDWIRADFDSAPALDLVRSMANFARIVERIRERSEAPILIYNVSSVVPRANRSTTIAAWRTASPPASAGSTWA